MTSLAARVVAVIRRRQLLSGGRRVLVALSGGADSVALTYLLKELASAGLLDLAGLAHFNHSLRGDESARDAAFCGALASDLGLPFDTETADVRALARESGRSVEDAARVARYAFLEGVRLRTGADLVATGHTRDDQAETVLLRLCRGAGSRGLAGIKPRRGVVIRPLIDLRHDDLLEYLRAGGHAWVEDSTNSDTAITRNWVRHAVLPLLAERFGDGVVDVLSRTADLARADETLLDELARIAACGIETADGPVVWLDVPALGREPLAVRQRVVRRALGDAGYRAASSADVARVLHLAGSGRTGQLRVGDRLVELSAPKGVLSIRGHEIAADAPAGWSHPLEVPGRVEVPEAAGRMSAERTTLAAIGGLDAVKQMGASRAVTAGVESDLVVRGWRPGDALQVLGLSGRKKKVQDLFVDRKVPRSRRHQVPLVTDAAGRIVWVAGHAQSEAFAVTSATKSVVVLSFEPFGGPE